MKRQFLINTIVLGTLSLVGLLSCNPTATPGAKATKGPKFAFVINNSSDFWTYAQAGLIKAEADFGITADFLSPAKGNASEQNRVLENIIQKGDYQGVAVSPIDPENQGDALNKVAAAMPLLCHDSDAPKSNRRFYIGTNNVDAGREMGKFIKAQLPEGGRLIITVGKLDALNAKQRREGLILEMGGSAEAVNGDASQPLTAGKYTVLETITDGADQTVAKRNAENAVTKYPDLSGFIGLWSYNAPQVLEALKSTGKLGQIRVFAFDEDPSTLAAITAGHCDGTLVQQPYEFGYQAMKYLKDIYDGKAVAIPASKEIPIPVQVVTKSTVAAFEKKLADLKAAAAAVQH